MSPSTPLTVCRAATLTGEDFHRLIRAVLPHTATDDALPALTAVHLETTGRSLYAAATDRYTIAAARHASPGALNRPRTSTAISRNAAMAMLRLVPRRSGQVTVHIRQGGAKLATTDVTYRAPAVTARSPDWRETLAHLLGSPALPSGHPVNVNPAHLARFKAASDRDGLRSCLHQTSPGHCVVIVSAGTWFLGALACIRPAETAADPPAAWENDLATPAAA